MDRGRHDRLSGLLADLEREHGPIDPDVMEEVRREWLATEQRSPPPLGLMTIWSSRK
jgi:hypothetical protein